MFNFMKQLKIRSKFDSVCEEGVYKVLFSPVWISKNKILLLCGQMTDS